MNSTISPLRRIAATVAIAGATTFGAVAIAPSASAAPASSASVTLSAPTSTAASAVAAASAEVDNSRAQEVLARAAASLEAKFLDKADKADRADKADKADKAGHVKECNQDKAADFGKNKTCDVEVEAPRF